MNGSCVEWWIWELMVRRLSALGRALRALRSSVTAWVLVLICTQTNILNPSGEKGKGIGTSIVHFVVNAFADNVLPADQLQAWIVRENLSSVRTFTKNGFLRSQVEKTQFYASMNREVVLENYFLNHA